MSEERVLDDWLTTYLEATANSEPSHLYRMWCGISTIAAALQRKCHLRWGTHLTFYPNMYIVLVGPSGARKGTAMGPAYRLLSDIGINMAAQKTTLEQLIRRLAEATGHKQDPTTGKLQMHSSLTIFSDELVVFLGYNQYDMMAALCDWFDCKDRWSYETKNKGKDEVLGVWVNLLGGTTPALIQSNLPLEAMGGGLTSRIIFVYAGGKEKAVPFPFTTKEERDHFDDLRADLERIHLMSGQFKITERFAHEWEQWYTQQEVSPPQHLLNDRFDGYVQRRPLHLLKLSMIVSASEGSEMILEASHLQRAIRILEATELVMPNVFRGVGRSPIAEVMSRVMGYLGTCRLTTYASLLQRFHTDADVQTMDKVVLALEKMGYLEREHKAGGHVVLKYKEKEKEKEKGGGG